MNGVALCICLALALCLRLCDGTSSTDRNCSYWYDEHPFPALCNPLGVSIVMRCIVYVPVNSSAELRWYWTPEEEDAGMCGTLITGEEDKYTIEYPNFVGVIEPYTGFIGNLKVLDFNLQDIGYYWCQIEDCDIHLASSRVGHFSNNSEAACSSTTAQLLESSLCAELPSPTAVSCVSSTYTAPGLPQCSTPTVMATSLVSSPQAPYTNAVIESDAFSYTTDTLPSRTPTASQTPPQDGSQLVLYVGIGLGVFGALVLAVACALLVFGVVYVVRCHSPKKKGSRDKQKVKIEEFQDEMALNVASSSLAGGKENDLTAGDNSPTYAVPETGIPTKEKMPLSALEHEYSEVETEIGKGTESQSHVTGENYRHENKDYHAAPFYHVLENDETYTYKSHNVDTTAGASKEDASTSDRSYEHENTEYAPPGKEEEAKNSKLLNKDTLEVS